jgi:thiol-disulfide isomerase/thioredoxin
MKKALISVIASFIILWGLYYFIFPVYFGIANPIEYWKVSKLPNFTFYQIDNDTVPFHASDLNNDEAIVLVIFNTECHYCQNELQMLSLNVDKFPDTQFLFVSDQRSSAIRGYLQEIGLYGRPNVFVARNKFFEASLKFGSLPIPTIFIYSKNRILRKRLIGEKKVEVFERYLN